MVAGVVAGDLRKMLQPIFLKYSFWLCLLHISFDCVRIFRCVDTLKNSQHSELANDLEINKAVMYLRQRDFKAAIDTLKVFDKVDTKVASHASTNLAFLFFLVRHALGQAESCHFLSYLVSRFLLCCSLILGAPNGSFVLGRLSVHLSRSLFILEKDVIVPKEICSSCSSPFCGEALYIW